MSPHERRSPFGDRWLRVLAQHDRPVTFDDLATAAEGDARYSDVVAWLARAQLAELIEDAGFAHDATGRPVGPRRFVLTERGARLVSRDRRRLALV